MPSFAFNADDVALGADRAIVSIGVRRLLFSNLHPEQIAALATARRTREISFVRDGLPLQRALESHGIVGPAGSATGGTSGGVVLLSSAAVSSIARALALAASAPALLLATVLSILAFGLGLVRLDLSVGVLRWIEHAPVAEFLVAGATFAGCILVHEIGHAAACYRRTGLVGCIRARLYRGIPVFTTDVSGLCLASPQGKAAIAIAGVVFQLGFSAILLASPWPGVRIGAGLSLLSAAFALVPLPGSDGFWFVSDLFGIRIAGPFGSGAAGGWIDRVYAAWLAIATGYFCYILLLNARSLVRHGLAVRTDETSWSVACILFGLYAAVVAVLFVRRSLAFLRNGDLGIR